MQYLFQVSIGPVQNFIASARKTRDLKFGSEFLSELSKAAAKKIAETYGIKSLIFPAPTDLAILEDKNFNVANKIVALIEASPEEFSKIRQAVFDRLHEIRDETYKHLGSFNKNAANAQIEDLVEFFWVALPYDDKPYKEIRENVEALMAARKNTRNFGPVTWGSPRSKSSIDGQLESVISDNNDAEYLYNKFGAKPGEHLSGVDLLKRKGPLSINNSFPSTSHIATIPFLRRLETIPYKEQAIKLWQAYIDKLQEIANLKGRIIEIEELAKNYRSDLDSVLGKYEGSLLFEARLVDMVEDISGFEPAIKALREFFECTDIALNKARPNPYYAILLADGDSMGKVIDHEAEKDSERHHQLSQELADFSANVRSIVESHYGSLVYAGGDDVLALMPLHTVLQCAQKLSEAFCKALRNFKEGALFGTSGLEFTITEKQRLGEARQLALAVAVDEKEAPELKEGIASLGGERRMVSWRKSNSDLPTCPDMIQDAIANSKACRIILLTPAYFEQGYYPTWLTKEHLGVTPQLAGIAIQRPQVASGWQLEKPAGPKPTRRLAPAGTVIFLNLKDNEDAAIKDWVNKLWMQCVSDDDPNGSSTQSRDDGFGLAVLGTWHGQPVAMQ